MNFCLQKAFANKKRNILLPGQRSFSTCDLNRDIKKKSQVIENSQLLTQRLINKSKQENKNIDVKINKLQTKIEQVQRVFTGDPPDRIFTNIEEAYNFIS
jgi:hypothetical protein